MNPIWQYESGPNGPENWHHLCEQFACGRDFPDQSPIELLEAQCVVDPEKIQLKFHYQRERFFAQRFNHAAHFVPPERESFVNYQGVRYVLSDIHFHTPGEHIIEKHSYPIECHLVHTHEQQNLVIGILLDLDEDRGLRLADIEAGVNKGEFFFNPEMFLPELLSYYQYEGSLTTPPTVGPIPWFVMSEPGLISNELYMELQGDNGHNNRPIQPLNGRKVYFVE